MKAYLPRHIAGLLALGVLLAGGAWADTIIRKELDAGVSAALRSARILYLEASLPRGDAQLEAFLRQYLSSADDWKQYRNRQMVAIPCGRLSDTARRRMLEALFPGDYVDGDGWWHTVAYDGASGTESLAALAEWVAGDATLVARLRTADTKITPDSPLVRGQRVLVPRELLLPAMRTPSPGHEPAATPEAAGSVLPPAAGGVLQYGEDRQGAYAEYRLQKGETLYRTVARFTDYYENRDILEACGVIQKRSGIRDARKVCAGQRVRIPLEMLSDAYQPAGTAQRGNYEAMRAELERVRSEKVTSSGLEGVVVILDPGHGGRDQGAAVSKLGLYEDELNYDIACRIKRILESETRAKVHMTVLDPNQQHRESGARRFTHDDDEAVLVTPNYRIQDAKTSANLRWYLANDLYRRERAAGVPERKVIFASIHCDAVYNDSVRGTMVYVPGADYRRDSETPAGSLYRRYKESRSAPTATCTASQRRKDEALSRAFAETFLGALRGSKPPVKVHSAGSPVRNVIRQRGGRAYVPAVLRNCCVPTKVLIEAANMLNAQDQAALADPAWREAFAAAFVDALIRHYK